MAATDFADRYFQLTNQDPYIQSVARPGQMRRDFLFVDL